MKPQKAVAFVDTTIVPDRNAGIGSLLWDLQHPEEPDRDMRPLLGREFAFIDVGVSRAEVATALMTLLARDLGLAVDYVATERPDAVPHAYVTLLGDRVEEIRGHLSGMMGSPEAPREVTSWHYVVDRTGRVSSVAYSYPHYGNEVCEAYFMGRAFMLSGERVEFSDPRLDGLLAPDVRRIEAGFDRERERERDPGLPVPSWDGYRLELSPLQAGLSALGIPLQETEVPRRINDRQHVLFLGNVLDHHPRDERAGALDRIAANLEEGDLVIVQMDGIETPSIEVLRVRGRGGHRTRERVRWIDTRDLEVRRPVRGGGSWLQTRLKPAVDRMASRLLECLGRKVNSPEWGEKSHRVLVHRYVRHVFRTHFRALPVVETFGPAVRESLRRLPSGLFPRGIPVFEGDPTDVQGGALGSDRSPILTEADLLRIGLGARRHGGTGLHPRDAREARAETGA